MRILVVGAGIAGLTFVRAMQRIHRSFAGTTRFSIDVVEKANTLKPGVGIILHPNGLKVIDVLGLLPEIYLHGNRIDTMLISRDDKQVTINFRDVWDGHSTIALQRNDLHTVLMQPSKESELPVNIHLGRTLKSISLKGTGAIAFFDDGNQEKFDLVIGADGVHSRLRRDLFPNALAVTTQLLYIRFLAENKVGFDANVWRTFEKQNASYGFIPLANNMLHCFVQLRTNTWPFKEDEAQMYFEKHIALWNPLLAIAFNARTTPLHVGFAYMVPPHNWSSGRCVLLGDSAHAVSPTLSEGGSLAMEDALVLALALHNSESETVAIIAYQNIRQERCSWAYRMALSQINSVSKRRPALDFNTASDLSDTSTRVMSGMYKPFLDDPLPVYMQSMLARITAQKTMA